MKENIDNQLKLIKDSAVNVQYTYIAHWEIVNRYKKRYLYIKIIQIILTALASGGFLTSIIANISWLSWMGALTSVVSLGFNLYMLNFNLPEFINQHTNAANELWKIREKYKALIVDYHESSAESVRKIRDDLIEEIDRINKAYPGTDDKSFKKAQKRIGDYKFEDGEADAILHL